LIIVYKLRVLMFHQYKKMERKRKKTRCDKKKDRIRERQRLLKLAISLFFIRIQKKQYEEKKKGKKDNRIHSKRRKQRVKRIGYNQKKSNQIILNDFTSLHQTEIFSKEKRKKIKKLSMDDDD